jgi:hypothetical protein
MGELDYRLARRVANMEAALGGRGTVETAADSNTSLIAGGGGGALTRWIWFAAQLGDTTGPLQFPTAIGLDAMIPVLDPTAHKVKDMTASPTSGVGYASPGGKALFNILGELLGWADGDEVNLEVRPCVLSSLDGLRWATFNLDATILDSTAPDVDGAVKHEYTSEEITITHQNATDFSVGEGGDILTAEGGAFTACFFCYALVV